MLDHEGFLAALRMPGQRAIRDSRAAYAALNAASAHATEPGEDRVERDTMFGPSNVAIHKVAIAVELGHPGKRWPASRPPTPLVRQRSWRNAVPVSSSTSRAATGRLATRKPPQMPWHEPSMPRRMKPVTTGSPANWCAVSLPRSRRVPGSGTRQSAVSC